MKKIILLVALLVNAVYSSSGRNSSHNSGANKHLIGGKGGLGPKWTWSDTDQGEDSDWIGGKGGTWHHEDDDGFGFTLVE
jgi:hypothetical protein